MPNLSIDSNNKWDGLTISPKTTAQTLELSTANTYVDRNIKIGIAAVSADTAKAVLGTGSCTVAGGGLSKGTASGGGLTQGTASGGSISSSVSDITGTNIGVDTTDTYGCGITVGASCSASREAFSQKVNRAEFSQTVTRAAITDAHTAGYIAAKTAATVTGLESTSETVTLAAGSSTVSLAAVSNQAGTGRTEYVTSLTVPSGKSFGAATNATGLSAITLKAGANASTKTSAYVRMEMNTQLFLTDAVTGQTWRIICDSANNALAIMQPANA